MENTHKDYLKIQSEIQLNRQNIDLPKNEKESKQETWFGCCIF